MENIEPPRPRMTASGRTHSPTREALLRALELRTEPVTVGELAREHGLHENTVRGHLQALSRDGYASSHTDPRPEGQGRPARHWVATRRAARDPYAALALAFAEALANASPDPAAAAREAGRGWGRRLGAELTPAATPAEARRAVLELMREQGFAPEPRGAADTSDGGERPAPVALRQCPLIDAASRRSDVVCAAHLGMISGALESIGARDAGSELTPFTAPGECLLRLRVA